MKIRFQIHQFILHPEFFKLFLLQQSQRYPSLSTFLLWSLSAFFVGHLFPHWSQSTWILSCLLTCSKKSFAWEKSLLVFPQYWQILCGGVSMMRSFEKVLRFNIPKPWSMVFPYHERKFLILNYWEICHRIEQFGTAHPDY